MGLLDRLHNSVTGLLSAVEAPLGLTKDLVLAPTSAESADGVTGAFYNAFTTRGAQLLQGAIGPQGAVGSLVGGLPEGARAPIREVYNPVTDTMDRAYHELVGQPLATAFTAGSLADRKGGGGVMGLLQGKTWAEAYNIAEHRSPGQSFALMFLTKDIKDPRQLAKAQATDYYHMASGVFDAAARIWLDPTAIAGGAAAKYYKGLHDLGTAEALARAESNGMLDKFNTALQGMSAAQIRHTYFPTHERGADISTLLASATEKTDRHRVLRVLAGAADEVDALRAYRPEIAGQLDRLMQRREMLTTMSHNGFVLANQPEDLAAIEAELNALHPQAVIAERLYQNMAALKEMPNLTSARLRGALTQSEWYQHAATSKPLRVVFNMEPHNLVRLDDPSGDIQLWRMLQKSDLPLERQQQIRSTYMAAKSPGERLGVLNLAEEEATKSIALSKGMTVDEVNNVLNEAARRRGWLRDKLNSRTYDGEGRSKVFFEDDTGEAVQHYIAEQPLFETQLPEMTPLADMSEVRKATTRIGQFRARHPSTDIPEELIQGFYRVWRPATLLRLGWPFRVIGDEQLRLFAKLGVITDLKGMRASVQDWRAGKQYAKAQRAAAELEPVAAAQKLAEAPTPKMLQSFQYKDYAWEGPFGSPGDGDHVMRHLNSSRASFGAMLGENGDLTDELYKTRQWQSISPDDPGHARAWEHAVNYQIGQSKLARQIVRNGTDETGRAATVQWLRSTPEGQAIRDQLPMRRDLDQWVGAAADQIDAYLPTQELRDAALKRTARASDLEKAVPDAARRPVVHGEILDQATGRSQVTRGLQKVVDKGFQKLGSQPSDVLSRNNYFYNLYNAEVRRQADLFTEGGRALSSEDVIGIQNRARDYALGETKNLLYDLAEESRLGDLMRYFAPFYPAWQEVTTRWAGLAVSNPAFVRRAQLVWQAPDKAGLVTDEHGNVVNEKGRITDPVKGGPWKKGDKSPSKQRLVTLSVPQWARDIPGIHDALQPGSKFKFAKSSLNLALNGVPSVGPTVAVPLNEIAKAQPDMASSLQWALPFGPTNDWKQLVLPTFFKRAQALSAEDDRTAAFTLLRRYNDMLVDYNLGKRKTRPTYQEARKDRDSFLKMRLVASWTLPFTPQFTSPYQAYIDSYRARREYDSKLTAEQKLAPDYQTPDDWFLTTYGDEFFPLTQSLSKSVDGVPPTLEGAAARQKYQDLIQADPELGALIVGAEGAGAFNRAVYEGQFAHRVGPGSGQHQREVQSFQDYSTSASTSLGWKLFGQVMDAIDAAKTHRGLTTLTSKGAEDLLKIKQATVAYLANDPQYQGWYDDYAQTDEAKWDKRINGLTKIATDKRMAARADIQGLAQYLEGRRGIVAALQAPGAAKTLTAKANAQLAQAWDIYVNQLVEQNPAFAALYYRWLQNDPVIVSPITLAAETGTYSA